MHATLQLPPGTKEAVPLEAGPFLSRLWRGSGAMAPLSISSH